MDAGLFLPSTSVDIPFFIISWYTLLTLVPSEQVKELLAYMFVVKEGISLSITAKQT